jgi:hypothetical protein
MSPSVDVLVVVVLDLHHLVAEGEGGPEALHGLHLARVEHLLQPDV